MAVQLLRCVANGAGRGLRAMAGARTQAWLYPASPASTPNTGCEQKRNYAMRMETVEYGLIWRRPTHVPSWQPEKSGDLEHHVDPDEKKPVLSILPGKSMLDQVDDVTRQLLSLKFGNHREFMKIKRYETLRKIQRHQYDTGSIEAMIAMLTVKIRNLQRITYITKKRTLERVQLEKIIDRRKKLLKNLRRVDYKRFEWLIEELGILYRPPPRYYRWIARRASIKRLVYLHGKELRAKRLAEYREILEQQKEPFLKEKAETLRWIVETETSLGVNVTVTVPEDSAATKNPAAESK
ncbi:small ribosomal subunit protein uS15m-like [Panulirus ornatus]|uniref:small ribosomal subunit protein uS15m-like n=1 Tax=Panulirus ornatus TaxID=150431 RepID=UPI003A8BDA95